MRLGSSGRVSPVSGGGSGLGSPRHHLSVTTALQNTNEESQRARQLQAERTTTMRAIKFIFEEPQSKDLMAAQSSLFTKDCVLFDPNNGGEFVGFAAVVGYMQRIRLAFDDPESAAKTTTGAKSSTTVAAKTSASSSSTAADGGGVGGSANGSEATLVGGSAVVGRGPRAQLLVAREIRSTVEEDKGRGSWMLTGTYRGRLGQDREDDNNNNNNNKDNNNNSNYAKGIKVSFKVVIAFKFATDSSMVQEMVVSWDAMSLMRQLHMLPTFTTASESTALSSSSTSSTTTTSTSATPTDPPWDGIGTRMPVTTAPAAAAVDSDTNVKRIDATQNRSRTSSTNVVKSSIKPNGQVVPNVHPRPKPVNNSKPLTNATAVKTRIPVIPNNATAATRASALRVKLSSKQTEALCRRLASLFARENHGDAVTIAHEVLDDRCLFLDSNMGGRFTGRTQCIRYVERLRSPFPKFVVKGMNTSALTSQPNGDSRVQVGWAVDAVYDGQLVKAPKACRFNGVLFVCFSGASGKIREVHMSWNATSLMQQLGVIAE